MILGGTASAAMQAFGQKPSSGAVIRPPGSKPEPDFLDACIRCGECMKVCPTTTLQPSFLEGGIHGVFTPHLVPRIGYCEYNCTLCGQVCPSGAIAPLSVEVKRRTIIGRAHFDTKRCLPYAKGISCIVCEEHCPTPRKAILFDEVEMINIKGEKVRVRQPYVKPSLCIGCGICEKKCPLESESAIRVKPL
jgi:MauM/NapG family ferredoxin protein